MFKRTEKCFGCAAVISFDHTKRAVIQRCYGRPYGDNGDAADNEKEIGHHQVPDPAEKNVNNIVFV